MLKFEQGAWLEPYITLNTTKRQEARNKFEEVVLQFFKQLYLSENMRVKAQTDARSHS